MRFLLCIAGLPQEAVEKVSTLSPSRLTGDKGNPPVVRRIVPPFEYRQGMSDYFHEELARRITAFGQDAEVGIALVYVNYPGSAAFVRQFFPFALAMSLDPIYLNACAPSERRSTVARLVAAVESAADDLRRRVAVVRDALSGQNFSPLTLPLRNFRSAVLSPTLHRLFQELGTAPDTRAILQNGRRHIEEHHCLSRLPDHLPFFEDARKLRFKSPGRGLHGISRHVAKDCRPTCLINSRARLGGPLKARLHYDCEYERRELDDTYPNCHGAAVSPAHSSHVNISPNDAIR